jgi:hypothetical protein
MKTLYSVYNILAPGYVAQASKEGYVLIYKESDPTKSRKVYYKGEEPPSAKDVYSESWELMRQHIRPSELLDLVVLRNERFEKIKAEYEDLEARFEQLRGYMGHDAYAAATEPEPEKPMSPNDWVDYAERKKNAREAAAKHEARLLCHIQNRARESECETAEALHAWVLKRYGKSRADACFPPDQWEAYDHTYDEYDEDMWEREGNELARKVLEEAATALSVHVDWENPPEAAAFREALGCYIIGRHGSRVAYLVFSDDLSVEIPEPEKPVEPGVLGIDLAVDREKHTDPDPDWDWDLICWDETRVSGDFPKS